MPKSISVHPKLAAAVDAAVSLVFLWALAKAGSWWFVLGWFLARLILWAVIIRLVYYPKELNRGRHILSLAVFSLGLTSSFLFMEWQPAWLAAALVFIFFPAFSIWMLPESAVSLVSFYKPHLRWRFMMSVLGLAGIYIGIWAVISFQIFSLNSFYWYLITAVIATAAAGWWWKEYKIEEGKRFWTWLGIWFLLMLEYAWVVGLLPLGYLASGLALVWAWYVLWLIARFWMTPEGIHWKKQSLFLIVNLVLYILFMALVVRWK